VKGAAPCGRRALHHFPLYHLLFCAHAAHAGTFHKVRRAARQIQTSWARGAQGQRTETSNELSLLAVCE
jgi:hypothetical protein